ncbi:MAG: ERF family protein [Pseudomonadota bacterium]
MNPQSKVEAATIASAMALAFGEIEAATKSANNPHFKAKYADLGSVIDAIKPALIKNSLFFTQVTHEATGGVCIETMIYHASGESMSGGKLFVPANKQDAQGFGSALTYARRYSLMTAFGVPAEDDDGNAAAKSAPRQVVPAPVKMATDDQCATIMQLSGAAGKSIQDIVEAHKVSSLPELTEVKAEATIRRLQTLARETANA